MIEEIEGLLNSTIVRGFQYLNNLIPGHYQKFFVLFFVVIIVSLYAIFVWKFYKFLAKRDLLELNLKQYNNANHPTINKVIALLLFIAEYLIILPIVTVFWFFVMALLLFFLAKDLPAGNILLISGSIIGAIRLTSYYSEDLSNDLAKLFPFVILSIALVTPGFFNISDTFSKFGDIGGLITNVAGYLLILIVFEFVLRMLYLIVAKDRIDG